MLYGLERKQFHNKQQNYVYGIPKQTKKTTTIQLLSAVWPKNKSTINNRHITKQNTPQQYKKVKKKVKKKIKQNIQTKNKHTRKIHSLLKYGLKTNKNPQ